MGSEVQWFEKPLGAITCNHDGKRKPVKESERKKGPYPYYGASGIVDYVDGYLFEGRHLLIAEDGENLRTRQTPIAFMADGKFWVNNHAHIVTGSDEVTTEYLHYFLQNADIQSYLTGAVMPKLTQGNLNRIPVRYPDLGYQKLIVQVLEGLDNKIDLNRRINQTLEAMAQAIFKSWFVDFDPVKAKIAAKQEGRDPLRAAMRAISGKPDAELDTLPPEHYAQLAATAALFPDEMEESELGEIPRGWQVNSIGQFGDVVCGKTPSKANPEYFGAGIPFIKIPDMHSSVYVVNPSEQLTALGAASQAKKTIPSGSVCVSCIATVGKVVITHEPSQTNQQINSIVPKFSQFTTYLYFQMKEKGKEFHDLASGGSATLNMNTSTFSKVNVLMPNFEVLTKFSVLVAPLFSEILLRQKESAVLSEKRDTLLPKLLSGELSVTGGMAEQLLALSTLTEAGESA
jgi:type I restriction enzyme S subunit